MGSSSGYMGCFRMFPLWRAKAPVHGIYFRDLAHSDLMADSSIARQPSWLHVERIPGSQDGHFFFFWFSLVRKTVYLPASCTCSGAPIFVHEMDIFSLFTCRLIRAKATRATW